ncbi:hypothetical protein PTSG_08244 [Salpingoeca rosetta]|uniref:Uncharacterized protein n=1 Tax=Salpingoeca rosetta (strain ATCC 50818 / BSB-021) TaxID=946362 RepID=F2UIF0_SALR5|nr:uncharacterized protein PTSG_08244 [Salpingoeca rosetta]EGD76899.1 hypothetical protein PTSG_08244 [Salpingoeca rosetta]|eukprot:XP_004991270.1 hypothetical protein PTSG_08244 [Salpingoeca rosetta]
MTAPRRESLHDELQAIESLIRSEEEAVLQELHSDQDQMQRLQELRSRTQQIFEQYDSSKATLDQMEKDLSAFKAQADLSDNDKATCAGLLSTVRSRQTKIERNQPARTQIMRELDMAVELTQSLAALGSHRDYTIMHAIKGLANTKALRAGGQEPKAEVFDKLRAVTSETQSLSVSHTNLRVRQGHCLRVATRLIGDVESVDVDDLRPRVNELISSRGTATSSTSSAEAHT